MKSQNSRKVKFLKVFKKIDLYSLLDLQLKVTTFYCINPLFEKIQIFSFFSQRGMKGPKKVTLPQQYELGKFVKTYFYWLEARSIANYNNTNIAN